MVKIGKKEMNGQLYKAILQLKDEQERSAELQEKEAYVGSDQYIVDTAKSKLGMTYPDEIVFKEK